MKQTRSTARQISHSHEGGNCLQQQAIPAPCGCGCFIIPHKVLEKFAKDKKLSLETRKAFANAADFDKALRKVRAARGRLALMAKAMMPVGIARAAAGGFETQSRDLAALDERERAGIIRAHKFFQHAAIASQDCRRVTPRQITVVDRLCQSVDEHR